MPQVTLLEVDSHETTMSQSEAAAFSELQTLTKKSNLKKRYAMPLVQLGQAIEANGPKKRSKSIVTILLEALDILLQAVLATPRHMPPFPALCEPSYILQIRRF